MKADLTGDDMCKVSRLFEYLGAVDGYLACCPRLSAASSWLQEMDYVHAIAARI